MRRMVMAMVMLLAVPAGAGEWGALSGQEIADALSGRELTYENGAVQVFRETGATTYSAGAGQSEGRWRVEGDEYCSNWPPSGTWSCYTLEHDDETGRFRFVGANGGVTVGSYSKE